MGGHTLTKKKQKRSPDFSPDGPQEGPRWPQMAPKPTFSGFWVFVYFSLPTQYDYFCGIVGREKCNFCLPKSLT